MEGLFWVIVIALAAFAYFGWRGRRVGSSVSLARSEAQSPPPPPPPPKQPSAAEQIEALRSAIRADFEQREAEKDAAADITTKKAVMVEAQSYLVAAGAGHIIDGFIREAEYWGSWQSKGPSESVPDAVVTRDQFSDRDAKGGSRSGYTFEHDGREWTFELQQDPSYGSTHRFGKFRVRQRDDLIFECGISEDYGREFSVWHANLGMVSVFKSADWLVDFAVVTELGRNLTKERDRARARADAVTRASATTWRRQEDPGDK